VAVVLMPEAGDVIQTLKAGLMEIADVFVVNKADRDGADRMVAAVRSMLEMAAEHGEWAPPVVTTQAHRNEGIDHLLGRLMDHKDSLTGTSKLEDKRRERRGEEFLGTIEEELVRRLKQRISNDPAMSRVLQRVEEGLVEPYSAAASLLDGALDIFNEAPPGVRGPD
jgi:LAO/AO transport system kinase